MSAIESLIGAYRAHSVTGTVVKVPMPVRDDDDDDNIIFDIEGIFDVEEDGEIEELEDEELEDEYLEDASEDLEGVEGVEELEDASEDLEVFSFEQQ